MASPLPVKTVSTVEPLGTPELEKATDPPEAKRRLLPDVTAVKVVAVTPLPQASVPPETPQLPLEDAMVKPEEVPDKVIVARVWVDHVPRVRRPPVVAVAPDWIASMKALVGRGPPAVVVVLPTEVVVVVVVPMVLVVPVPVGVALFDPVMLVAGGRPDFGGYEIPLDGQLPAAAAD